MARVLGYGGIANTNGARNFSGKVEAAGIVGSSRISIGISIGLHSFMFLIGRGLLEIWRL